MTGAAPLPVVREAVTLPLALLTVSLFGGLRLPAEGGVRFVPPPLLTLVLATLLIALLVRAGALAANRLFSPARGALENASGAMVLIALLGASAQVFHLLTPDRGLSGVIVSFFFVALLANTFARRTERGHLLTSLAVMFGGALVLKFVLLDGLAAPGDTLARRLIAGAVESVTVSVLGAERHAPAMGYVAFAVTALYLIALWWLPGAATSPAPPPRETP